MECSHKYIIRFVTTIYVWRLGVHMRVECATSILILGGGVVDHNTAQWGAASDYNIVVKALASLTI